MRLSYSLSLALLCALIFTAPAAAEDYPTRPVTMLVGFAPGGGVDITARQAAEHMSVVLGQRIVIENRAGANSAIATRMVARGKTDGYTLLFSAYVISTNIYGMKEPGYKLEDFVNIGGYGHTGYTLLANTKSSGAKTVQEFIEYGRKNHGKLTYGSLGSSSSPNLVAHHFDSVARMGWREIPFKSAADAIAAVITGTIDVYFAGPATALAALGQPDLKVLAVTGKGRSSMLPDVPTFTELGIPLNDSYTLGIFAPAATPQPIVDKLRQAMDEAKKNPENRKKIVASGLEVYGGSWQDFDREMAEDSAINAAAFKRLGIEPQ